MNSVSFQPVSAKRPSNNLSNIKFKLTANELLFIPKHYDPTPMRHPTKKTPNDLVRKRNYMKKIQDKSPDQQRQFRANQDARYLHHKAKNANELSLLKTKDDPMLCLDHLNNRCKDQNCDKYHQIRNPRLFGLCKHYVAGSCRNGDSCSHMHEEFPCHFYHLNLSHPKTTKMDKCRFKHGGPLSRQLSRYFKKHLEEWVKHITNKQPEQFDDILTSYLQKFDEKQIQLEQEYGISVAPTPTSTEEFSFEHILSADQIRVLAKKSITDFAQLNRIPVDELIDLGLTMDQIYKITINTCNESDQNTVDQDDMTSNSLNDDALNLSSSSSSTGTMDTDKSFEGFCDIELDNAVHELQCKQADGEQTVINAIDSNTYDLDQVKIGSIVNSNADNSDDSVDSDDEFNLLIDEDVQ